MAKAKIEGLDKAIDKVFTNYKSAFKKAAQDATKKAKEDLYSHAVSCLVSYYEDYDPTSYSRTYSLIQSFVPYMKGTIKKGEITCIAGVEFDPSRLDGMYYGSEIYTDPTHGIDGEWVISNFLAGIHPRTNGSEALGGGNYEHEVYYGSFVPAEEMQRFIDSYYYKFDYNLRKSISEQILKNIRR